MVALVNSERWKNLVQLQIYYLDNDPAAGRKYESIVVGTAVINQAIKLPRVTIATLTTAFEQAAKATGESEIGETKYDPALIKE